MTSLALVLADEAIILIVATFVGFIFLLGPLDRLAADGAVELAGVNPGDDARRVEDVAALQLDGVLVFVVAIEADDAVVLKKTHAVGGDLELGETELHGLLEVSEGVLLALVVHKHRSDRAEEQDGGGNEATNGAADAEAAEDEENAHEDQGNGGVVRRLAVVAIREVDHISVDDPASDNYAEGSEQAQGPGDGLERALLHAAKENRAQNESAERYQGDKHHEPRPDVDSAASAVVLCPKEDKE